MSDDDHPPPSRRKMVVYGESFDPRRNISQVQITQKAEKETKKIFNYLRSCFLFDLVPDDDLLKVISTMIKIMIKKNTQVCKEGEPGDYYYVVDHGTFQVSVNGHIVNTYVDFGGFGELALMYNTGRQATVTALTDGSLWAMKRQHFKVLIVHSAYEKRRIYDAFLLRLDFLKGATQYDRSLMVDSIRPRSYFTGEKIYSVGDNTDGIYYVEGGIIEERDSLNRKVGTYTSGNHFGDCEVVSKEKRRSTMVALQETQLAFFSLDAYNRITDDTDTASSRMSYESSAQ